MIRRARTIAALVAACAAVLGVSSQAFTAANTVPNTAAGSGSGTVSGYTITNVDYTLNGTDPDKLDQVEFDMNPATSGETVIKLNAQKYTCTMAAGHATCATTAPQATPAGPTTLSVIAAD